MGRRTPMYEIPMVAVVLLVLEDVVREWSWWECHNYSLVSFTSQMPHVYLSPTPSQRCGHTSRRIYCRPLMTGPRLE